MTISDIIQGIINARNKIRTKMINAGQATATDNLDTLADNLTITTGGGGADTSDATAVAGDILASKTAYISSGKVTGTMTNRGKVSPSALNAGQSYTIPKGYHDGTGTVTTNSLASQTSGTATAANIDSGKTAWVDGTKLTGTGTKVDTSDATATADRILSGYTAYVNGSKITGTISSKSAQTYTPGTSNQTILSGQYLSGIQTISGDTDLKASNIKSGVSIFGVTGTYSGLDTSDATATASRILNGYTAYVNGSKVTGNISSKAAQTYTPGTSNQTISSGQYLSGAQTISGDSNLKASNIKSGVSIFGVSGSYSSLDTSDATATAARILSGYTAYAKGSKITGTISSKSAQTYTPGTSSQTISSGQYLSGTQTISGDSNLKAANIKSGVSIFGVTGTYSGTNTSDATATASDILSGKTAYVNGSKITGTIATRSQSNATISSATTYSAGYYPSSFTITPSAKLSKTLLWTNPWPNTTFNSYSITLSKNISTSGEYLLMYYKDSISASSATRHLIFWAPIGYSSCIDVRIIENSSTGFYSRNFFVTSSNTIYINNCLRGVYTTSSDASLQIDNNMCIPYQIYSLGTGILE